MTATLPPLSSVLTRRPTPPTPRAIRVAGFTLVELIVAIVLLSVVVLLGYGAAQVSYDARARLTADLQGTQGARALREVLQDALRNARTPLGAGDPGFALHAGRLSFVAAGGGPPFDPEYDWLITIEPRADGLELFAAPLGRAPGVPLAFRVPGVQRWDVRALGPGGSQWLTEWPAGTVLPRAVAITLWRDAERVGFPLQVALLPLGVPPASDESPE